MRKHPLHDPSCDCDADQPMSWTGIAGMLLVVLAAYWALRTTGLFSLSSSLDGAANVGAVFLVGLVAATSTCLAVVGGLLLSVSAKWAEAHRDANKWSKLQPLLLFNAGRLIGYFVLGGLAGLLGTAISLTPRMNGYVSIVVALAMLLLGLNILRILPKKYCTIPLPSSFRKRITRFSESRGAGAPMLVGALTFFLPCGFTQSMQLLALGSGGFVNGGLIMLVFALGTLPSLLGISVISSLVTGRTARYFFTFSGVVVVLLALVNLQSGLVLTGIDTRTILERAIPGSNADRHADDPYVSTDAQGRQILTMYVSDAGYSPNTFTIEAGKPTWIYALAPNGVSGCAGFLTAPDFNVSVPIRKGENWLGPLNPNHDFILTCSMGMLRAHVRVKQS